MKTVNVPLPINLEKESSKLFEPYSTYQIKPQKIKKLKNVFISYTGLALNKNGLVKECHHGYPQEYNNCLSEVFSYYNNANDNSDHLIELDDNQTYLVIHHPWFNYYHWICEAIPRLWLVKNKTDAMILVLPDYYEHSDFIMGSLEPFNIKNILFIPNPKSLFVKNLCLPELKPYCDSYDIKKLKEIRNFYLNYVNNIKNIYIDKGDKIYLSRKKALRKKVVNEPDVEKIMQKYGFTILDNEDYTFLEQISIYANAKYLISIHGSGMTNLLFMKEDSHILEIHKKKTNSLNHPSFVFWYEAAALGFNYYHQTCNPITEDDDYFFGDFNINIELLESNIKKMLDN